MERQRANSSTVTITRDQVFAEFHARTGLEWFAPDFLNSLWKVMRDRSAGLAERVWAWHRWRANGNSSESPVSDWNPAYAKKLRQSDCAIDLEWLAEGQSLEWVEKADVKLRAAKLAAMNWKGLKGYYGRAFKENRQRGLLDRKGKTVYTAPSCPLDPPAEKVAYPGYFSPKSFSSNKEFLEWYKVAYPGYFQAWEAAETARREAREVAQASYREWLNQATFGAPSLYVKTDKDSGSEDSSEVPLFDNSSSSSTAEIPTTTMEPPEPREPEPDRKPPASEVSKQKLRRIAAGAGVYLDDGLLEGMIRECRARRPAATEDEIARFLALKLPIAKSKANPPGFLRTAVAACFDGQGLDQFGAYHDDAPTMRCVACGGYGTTVNGELCEMCHGAKVMAVASG